MPEWHDIDIGVTIRVDHNICAGQAECAAQCPAGVYEIEGDKAFALGVSECIECCTCVSVCPEGAITHSSCD